MIWWSQNDYDNGEHNDRDDNSYDIDDNGDDDDAFYYYADDIHENDEDDDDLDYDDDDFDDDVGGSDYEYFDCDPPSYPKSFSYFPPNLKSLKTTTSIILPKVFQKFCYIHTYVIKIQ